MTAEEAAQRANRQDAARQLCVLFAMLPPARQPTALIAEVVAAVEAADKADKAAANGGGSGGGGGGGAEGGAAAAGASASEKAAAVAAARQRVNEGFVSGRFAEEDRKLVTLPSDAFVLRRTAVGMWVGG